MPEKNEPNLQGSMYDKIFRENMREILPGMINNVLQLDLITIQELKDDVQFTKERKTDCLKKVLDAEGNEYVLHVEYQTDDYPKMHFRMAEYSVMLQRKYDLPVSQFVIYIGPGTPRMPTVIRTKDLWFRYSLTALSDIDYRLFLKSDKIEERMLAFLGKVNKNETLKVLKQILADIKDTSTDELSTDRYVQQLHVLVKLRNLGPSLEKHMITISKFFKEEEDLLFRKGQEKGIEKGEARKDRIFVENLLLAERFSIAEIANFAGVTEVFVKKVNQEIKRLLI